MNRKNLIICLFLTLLSLFTVVCDTTDQNQLNTNTHDESNFPNLSRDQWNSANNPNRFNLEFEYNYRTLVKYKTGMAAQIPWPSDYWPAHKDSTNFRYHGSDVLSPLEKYDVAFNNWVPDDNFMDLSPFTCNDGSDGNWSAEYYKNLGPLAQWVSINNGNLRARNGVDDDGDGEIDECDDYDGIESWWGMSHAWTAASILEAEPLHPVTVNGVTFTVSDIKALLVTLYNRFASNMVGDRCNLDDEDIPRDEHGRIIPDECRDTNPGTFFVSVVNMLGKYKRVLAEDRAAGDRVWNHPILRYKIKRAREIPERRAMRILGRKGEDYNKTFNSPDAEKWMYVKMNVTFVIPSRNIDEGLLSGKIRKYTRTDRYEMVLELDSSGSVIGGEWVGNSREHHPDFLWLPTGLTDVNPHISIEQVRKLLELSRTDEEPDNEIPASHTYTDEPNLPIPDNNPEGISTTIEVPDSGIIQDLKVSVDITHTYSGDLIITLNHNGVVISLQRREGGNDDYVLKTYDVSGFDATPVTGEWTLTVMDVAGNDIGTLNGWSMAIRID